MSGKVAEAQSQTGYVYLLEGGGYHKIGRAKDPWKRSEQLAIQLPYPVRLVCTWHSSDYRAAEKAAHDGLAEYRVNGEWFHFPEGTIPWVQVAVRVCGVDYDKGLDITDCFRWADER